RRFGWNLASLKSCRAIRNSCAARTSDTPQITAPNIVAANKSAGIACVMRVMATPFPTLSFVAPLGRSVQRRIERTASSPCPRKGQAPRPADQGQAERPVRVKSGPCRYQMSALPPKADIGEQAPACPLCARSGHSPVLFDHLVGAPLADWLLGRK